MDKDRKGQIEIKRDGKRWMEREIDRCRQMQIDRELGKDIEIDLEHG